MTLRGGGREHFLVHETGLCSEPDLLRRREVEARHQATNTEKNFGVRTGEVSCRPHLASQQQPAQVGPALAR